MKSSEITQLQGRLLTSRLPPDPDPAIPITTVTTTNPTTHAGAAPHAAASFSSLPPELLVYINQFLPDENDKINFAAVNNKTLDTLPSSRDLLLKADKLAFRLSTGPCHAMLLETLHEVINLLSHPNPVSALATPRVLSALQQLVNDPHYWPPTPLKIRLTLDAPLTELRNLLRTTKTAPASLKREVADLQKRLNTHWFDSPRQTRRVNRHVWDVRELETAQIQPPQAAEAMLQPLQPLQSLQSLQSRRRPPA